MKYFLALSAVILAISALPTDVKVEQAPINIETLPTDDVNVEQDPLNEDIVRVNINVEEDPDSPELTFDEYLKNPANFTDARVPFGQAGFASMHGGTHGGNGGPLWTVWDVWALRDAVNGNARRYIHVTGFIDFTPMFTGSPGVRFAIGSYKTISGIGRYATIYGGGMVISGSRQVIIQNLRFHNALNYAPGEQPNGQGGIISMVPGPFSTLDALGVERFAEFVWIHHCDFADDPWIAGNTPANMRRHDGLLDITNGASMISVSNTIFRNHVFVSLVGNSDNNAAVDRNRLKVTYYHNWFIHVNQRNPFVRYGEVHVVNNLFQEIDFYGVGVGTEGQVYTERNVFINCARAWTGDTPGSRMRLLNNILVNSGYVNPPGLTINWRPEQYYNFPSMHAQRVEAYVRTHVGPR